MNYATRQLLPSVSLASLKNRAQRDLLYQPVALSGIIDNQHSFLLDNQVVNRKVGFRIFSVLQLKGGLSVLVDRGWVPGDFSRKVLPDIPAVSGQKKWQGILWRPAGQAFLLKKDVWSEVWPKVIQAIDMPAMEKSLGVSLFPWIVVLNSDQPGVFLYKAPMLNMKASRHLGYAVQWWLMALALVILCVFLMWRAWNERKCNE